MLAKDIQTRHYLLKTLGVTEWLPRQAALMSYEPLFCAACLVLLPKAPTEKTTEPYIMLMGMLSVLDLKKEEICIAWVNDLAKAESDFSLVKKALLEWAPNSILIMGKTFAERLSHDLHDLHIPVQTVYHPDELVNTPERKKEAYQDLLQMKKMLRVQSNG